MTEYVSFLMSHAFLSAGFLIVLVLLIANEIRAAQLSGTQCSPQTLVNAMNHDNAMVIDLRERHEFKAGHIAGSTQISAPDLITRAQQFDKAQPIILVCANGQESMKYAKTLQNQALKTSYLNGGIAAWRQEGMPLTK